MATPAAPALPDETVEAPPPKKSKKKALIVSILVILLAVAGAATWLLMPQGSSSSAAEEEPPKVPVFLPLETFTVNLQDGEQYLQVDITLQVADQIQADAIKLHMPRIRSRLLTLLSSKQADDLMTPDAKKALAQEIRAQVAQPLYAAGKAQQVEDVLFTSFVIQ